MKDRFVQAMLVLLAVLLLGLWTQPYVDRFLFYTPAPRPVEPRGNLSDIENSIIEMFERTSPSVVQIEGRTRSSSTLIPADEIGIRSGTGFIWDADGHVVTNDHVVAGTANISVRLSNGEVVQARIVGVAPTYDVAVIELRNPRHLPQPIMIGRSNDLKVGQFAFAIGSPYGLDQSLSMGVISALKRQLPTTAGREISNVIQIDTPINPGNSGGPLLDSAGRVVGINTAIVSPAGSNAGVGFAIPIDIVNRVVPQLIAHGRVPTPGIGIVPADADMAIRLGIDGAVVLRTIPGSPAARAGLKGIDLAAGVLGDVIIAANDKPVRVLSDLTDQLDKIGVGGKVHLGLKRNSHERSIDLQVIDIEVPSK